MICLFLPVSLTVNNQGTLKHLLESENFWSTRGLRRWLCEKPCGETLS